MLVENFMHTPLPIDFLAFLSFVWWCFTTFVNRRIQTKRKRPVLHTNFFFMSKNPIRSPSIHF